MPDDECRTAGGTGGPEHPGWLPADIRCFADESLAIVCIGNELRGDDGAGPAVARELAGAVPWQVYDCGPAPENFLGRIAAGRPDAVVVIDAIDFCGPPGAVKWLESGQIVGQGPGTHGPAPVAFLDLLARVHPCRCGVLGIQPRQTDFGAPMSGPVRAAVEQVARAFLDLAGRRRAANPGRPGSRNG